jgi:hypothetical protein
MNFSRISTLFHQQFHLIQETTETDSQLKHLSFIPLPCRMPFSAASSIPLCYILFLPPFSTNYSSILSHFILPSISWSTFWSCPFLTAPFVSVINLFQCILTSSTNATSSQRLKERSSSLKFFHFVFNVGTLQSEPVTHHSQTHPSPPPPKKKN